jgi:hypothetical protein
MSSRDKKADVVRSRIMLGLAVVVLVGICVAPSIPSLYARWLTWSTKGFCESIMENGYTYGSASDDYATQLKRCERNPG